MMPARKLFCVLQILVAVGCASRAHYEEASRGAAQVAVVKVKSWIKLRHVQPVNGIEGFRPYPHTVPNDFRHDEFLPGRYEFAISIDPGMKLDTAERLLIVALLLPVLPFVPNRSPLPEPQTRCPNERVVVSLAAGRTYLFNGDDRIGCWVWVEEQQTGRIVAGRKPE